MARLVTYLALLIGGLAFWAVELTLNYQTYSGHDPYSLGSDYQEAYVVYSSSFLFAELAFPLGMTLAFLLLLAFKLAARPVRTALALVLLVCAEFWMWRLWVFKGRMALFYLQNEANDPALTLPDHFREALLGFGLALLLVIGLRERKLGNDSERLHQRLRRRLRFMKPEQRT